MTRVDFYHLQKSSLDQVLPKLCEKAYATGKRIKVLLGVAERVDFINTLLWTYADESFLPHGSKKDGFVEEQPIFISADEENENHADLLILADGAILPIEKLKDYERVLNIFDGNDEDATQCARNYWKEIKSSINDLHYWQQNTSGVFEQKL